MDGNKDDALKCLKIGREAMEAGDRARAVKFLNKARRLDPSLPIDDLFSDLDRRHPGDADPPPSESDKTTVDPSPSLRHRVSSEGISSASSSPARSYTEEQITIVRQIKRQKDYYEILGVERTCSVEDVRKGYRKLSLKVHPDKNKAPGAEEAFKLVSKAFQCLSNEETRKRYDLVGSDEPITRAARPARDFNGFYEADIDADEIFRNFFFGGGGPVTATPFGTFRFRTGGMGPSFHQAHGGGGGAQGGSSNLRALIQILPVLLLLLLNFLPSSEPVYSLYRTGGHQQKMETARGAPYYVISGKFESDYPQGSMERTNLELRIDRDYVAALTQSCRNDLQRRMWGLSNQTPYCDMLEKFEGRTVKV
ncbi:Chaperone protein dnaJ 49 [Acorus calamus]|uniref:Chaperone protein dnaJ 49 n=1 Tax=Acorus calamus TaxID=4465 RepID=A0AAV9C2M2_ACOCL|nr:Chaperone protein dnaJ 49 [Acorus calamus]